MLYRTVLLNLAVATVVVGEEQAVRRDYLACATSAKTHYGVFQRGFVDTIDIFGCELETLGLHVVYPTGDEQGQPHAFVGFHWHQGRKQY